MAKKRDIRGVVGYIDQVIAELTGQAPKAIRHGEQGAVHRARVATRRLGAALVVLQPVAGEEDIKLIGKALKRVRQSVQTLRDLDVMQAHLEDREKKGLHGDICIRLKQAMAQERDRMFLDISQNARVERWLSRVGHWMALRGAMLGRNDQITDLVRKALDEQFSAFATQAQRLSAALLGAQEHADIEPHALRIAGKSLRYTFEMAQAQGLPVANTTLRTYKKLQDALGLWQDYHVLSQHIAQCCLSEMKQPAYHYDEDQMLLLAARVIGDSHRELRRFAQLWGRHQAQLVAQLEGVLPKAPPAHSPPSAALQVSVQP